MIDFRYHLVSIVAVFLALAIGIVLGSTELQGPTYNFLNRTTAKLQNQLDQTKSNLSATQAQAGADEAYAEAVEPTVLRGLLAGQRLVIVTEPGAQPSVVSGISAAAIDAGATVTGQISLAPRFFDTTGTVQDSLNQATLNVAQSAGIPVDAAATYQQQAAQVIATEILTKAPAASAQPAGAVASASADPSASPDPSASAAQSASAATMFQAYAASQFLSITGQPGAQATLAVVVTPQNVPSDGRQDPVAQLLVPVVHELAAKAAATVVVGSSAGSGDGSPMAVVRMNDVASQVSTVDDADLVSGQTVAIQALAIALGGGKTGSYGFTANGATAVAPSPAPTATVSPSATPTQPAPATAKKARK
ncbi:MAG: copper transporter [Actinobacteria bacterium]|nr:copper transporter [Actinomycetota bacterium]